MTSRHRRRTPLLLILIAAGGAAGLLLLLGLVVSLVTGAILFTQLWLDLIHGY